MVGREPGSFDNDPDSWLSFIHPDDLDGLKEAMELAHSGVRDYHRQYRVMLARRIGPLAGIRWQVPA